MSIADFFHKIKGKGAIDKSTILYLLVVCGVGVSAFGLGRLSVDTKVSADDSVIITDSNYVQQNMGSSVKDPTRDDTSAPSSSTTASQKNFVASKNGKLYYPAGCKSANRIKPANEVWFKSSSDAEKSGYKRSPSCK